MARELQRFHEIWCGAHGVASAASAAPIALSAIEDFVVPADTCEDDEVEQQEEAASQCLMDNLLGLGVSAQRACQIAAAGHLWLDNAEIAFEPACRGKALLLHISLQNGPLDGTGEAALWLNNKLMAEHGLAMGRGEHGYRLLAHWPCDGRAGLAFKDYLLTLADLPTTLIGDTASRGQADNELDALLRI